MIGDITAHVPIQTSILIPHALAIAKSTTAESPEKHIAKQVNQHHHDEEALFLERLKEQRAEVPEPPRFRPVEAVESVVEGAEVVGGIFELLGGLFGGS